MFTANAVLALPPPPLGGESSGGSRSHGVGPDWGPRRGGGGKDEDALLPHVGARWGGVPGEEGRCLAGTFLSFISRFFLYLNLQICIIQGQPIKEDYNGGHWEIKVRV